MSLRGVRVAVTRARSQASELIALLEAEGARVAAYPLIRIAEADGRALARVLRDGPWDWVVFTSANAVRACSRALEATAGPPLGALLGGARIACVGPATAQAASGAGLNVTAVADDFLGASIASAMRAAQELRCARVLWPRAEAASDAVAESLTAAGAQVTAPVAYRTVLEPAGARELARATLQADIDVVTFTAPSAVRSLAAVLPALDAVRVVAIGPVTAEAARAAGYRVDAVAVEHTAAGLVDALRGLYG